VAWQVVSYLPNTLKVLVRVAAVCTSWRQAVLEADPVSGWFPWKQPTTCPISFMQHLHHVDTTGCR
jgi:hypothetical protein